MDKGMSIEHEIAKVDHLLDGDKITSEELLELQRQMSKKMIPDWLGVLLVNYPLTGSSFEFNENDDVSGLGGAMVWLSPKQIVSEALEAYPGILVLKQGYLPIGDCLEGSGDYYYLKLTDDCNDPALVRVPHESAVYDPYPEEDIELVFNRLSELFQFIEKDQ